MDRISFALDGWRLSPLALPMLLSLCDPLEAQTRAPGHTDPAAIDAAVAQFTGAGIGAPGGARQATDRRLQLAACNVPLAVSWHTPAQLAVAVECPGPARWRIFVAVNAAASAAARPAHHHRQRIAALDDGRGFSVQQSGEAMEAGAVGQWIFVRTSRKGEPLRARVERPGLAVIPAD